jgi:hypothetical protein
MFRDLTTAKLCDIVGLYVVHRLRWSPEFGRADKLGSP